MNNVKAIVLLIVAIVCLVAYHARWGTCAIRFYDEIQFVFVII